MTDIDVLGGNYLRLALAGTELDHRRRSRSHVDGPILKGASKSQSSMRARKGIYLNLWYVLRGDVVS